LVYFVKLIVIGRIWSFRWQLMIVFWWLWNLWDGNYVKAIEYFYREDITYWLQKSFTCWLFCYWVHEYSQDFLNHNKSTLLPPYVRIGCFCLYRLSFLWFSYYSEVILLTFSQIDSFLLFLFYYLYTNLIIFC